MFDHRPDCPACSARWEEGQETCGFCGFYMPAGDPGAVKFVEVGSAGARLLNCAGCLMLLGAAALLVWWW